MLVNCNCFAIKNELTLIWSNTIENRFVWLSKRGSDGFQCDGRFRYCNESIFKFSAFFPSFLFSFSPFVVSLLVYLSLIFFPLSIASIIYAQLHSKRGLNCDQAIIAIAGHRNIKSCEFVAQAPKTLMFVCCIYQDEVSLFTIQSLRSYMWIEDRKFTFTKHGAISMETSTLCSLCADVSLFISICVFVSLNLFSLYVINFVVYAILVNWIVIPTLNCVQY